MIGALRWCSLVVIAAGAPGRTRHSKTGIGRRGAVVFVACMAVTLTITCSGVGAPAKDSAQPTWITLERITVTVDNPRLLGARFSTLPVYVFNNGGADLAAAEQHRAQVTTLPIRLVSTGRSRAPVAVKVTAQCTDPGGDGFTSSPTSTTSSASFLLAPGHAKALFTGGAYAPGKSLDTSCSWRISTSATTTPSHRPFQLSFEVDARSAYPAVDAGNATSGRFPYDRESCTVQSAAGSTTKRCSHLT